MKELKNILINKRVEILSVKGNKLSNELRAIYIYLKTILTNASRKNINDYMYALATRFFQVNP